MHFYKSVLAKQEQSIAPKKESVVCAANKIFEIKLNKTIKVC